MSSPSERVSGKPYPRIASTKILCKGKRFSLAQVEILDEKGVKTVKDLLVHPGAVAVLPILDNNRIILLRQYRPGPGKWIYEVPAGTIEPGESPEETARRELEEETGYTASQWDYVATLLVSPGVSTEKIHLFIARGLQRRHEPRPEKGEYIEVVAMSLDEAKNIVLGSGEIDAKTGFLLLYYLLNHRE